jgi:hypothetical protein
MQVNLGVPDGLLENGSPSSPEFAELLHLFDSVPFSPH